MARVLHVINGLGDGGAERSLFKLLTGDREHSHSVISLMGAGKYGSLLEESGVPVHYLGASRQGVSLSQFLTLFRIIRLSAPDVVQTWLYHSDFLGSLAARLAGVPRVIWNVRNGTLSSRYSNPRTYWLARALGLLSRWLPEKIVSCSQAGIDAHIRFGYSSKKFVLIPNGIDVEAFQLDRSEFTGFWSPKREGAEVVIFGMVARFDPQKNHRGFLEALARLPPSEKQWHAVLAGTGCGLDNEELISWIKRLKLTDRVTLLGQVTDVAGLMSILSVLVVPSAYGEGSPNVVLEAMASEVPCVVGQVGDSPTMVGTTGWIFSGDEGLLECLTDALGTTTRELSDRGAAAKARVMASYSLHKTTGLYAELYRA